MPDLYSLLGVTKPFDPTNRYTTSPPLSPLPLAVLRLIFSVYAFTTIFVILIYDSTHNQSLEAQHSFSYFTVLTYWGLAFYLLFSGLHTLSFARRERSWLQAWPRPLQAAHAVLYTSIVTFPLLVTIVFWGLLYSGTWFKQEFLGWSNISQHALNTLFALLEILLPRTSPPPLLHLPILILLLALYLSLAYITHATQGFYPYTFLDPSSGHGKRVAGYCFGILAAACVIFGLVWCLIWSRNWLAREVGLDGVGLIKKRKRSTLEGLEEAERGDEGVEMERVRAEAIEEAVRANGRGQGEKLVF